MKKYLMMALAVLAVVSCSKDKMDFSDLTQAERDKKIYEDNFRAYLNNQAIDAGQTWGFGDNISRGVTRGSNTNGNQWEDQGWTVPADITAEEIAKVKAVFAQKGEASYTSLVDWNDYFVQQVYCGDSVYYAKNGQPVTGAQHMDHLITVETIGVNIISWWPYEEEVVTIDPTDQHINNFNNASCPDSWVSEKTGKKLENIMLMTTSNTNKFGFISSEDSKVHYNFRMEEIDGAYYVGFDFEASGENPNQQVDRDFVYDDWIVKIVPGKGVSEPNLRILAEDLSATGNSDFDFNDAVIDVEMGSPAKVKIIAAGATLPIRINGKDEWEIHRLLMGNSTQTFNDNGAAIRQKMINTGAKADINGVPAVYVPGFAETITSAAEANTKVKLEVFKNGVWQELTAKKGEPACKLAVSTTFGYLAEKESIKDEYPTFLEWATGTNFRSKWW